MTINEHVNAIYSAITTMSEKELEDLEKSLTIVLTDIRSHLRTNTHSHLPHGTAAEGKN